MSRRLPYVVAAALLVLVVTVFVWRAGVGPDRQATGAAPQSLAADVALLASGRGKWQSEVLKITGPGGTVHDEILEIQFNPSASAGQSNAPDAMAKLFTTSPPKGIPHLAEVSTSLGNGSFRNVRLRETNGVRTISITRAVPTDNRNPAKTQRIYDRFWSVSFRYELKNNVLTLKGFPTTNKVNWGVSEFMVSQAEIKFKIVP